MKSKLRNLLLLLVDLSFVLLAYVFCVYICRLYVSGVDGSVFLYLVPLILGSYAVVLPAFGVYRSLWRYAQSKEFFLCVGASVTSGSVFFGLSRLLPLENLPLSFYVMTMAMVSLTIVSVRLLYRIYRDHLNERSRRAAISGGLFRKRAMIFGSGQACQILLGEINTNPTSHLNPVVLVDDDLKKQNKKIMGVLVAGDRHDIPRLCAQYSVEIIILAIPGVPNEARARILDECTKTNCVIKSLPSLSEITADGGVALSSKLRNITMEELLGRDTVTVDDKMLSEFISGKTVLVTGGGGSIGSELCRQVAARMPLRLIIVDIYENNAYSIQQELERIYRGSLDITVVIGTVRDARWIRKIMLRYRPDIVLHAAAHKHVPLMEGSPLEAIKNNIFGTYNTALAANDAGVGRFILISTDKAVNPTNIMGASKRVCEMIIKMINDRSRATLFVAVRFGNVLGSNGSVIPMFKKQIENGGPVTVTRPEIIRYFMTIPEAASLVLSAGAIGRGGEIFVLDMGEPVKIDDLARKIIRLSGLVPDVDIKIEYVGLRSGEKLYEELLMAEEGMTRTMNKKIFIGHQIDVDAQTLSDELGRLSELVDEIDGDDTLSEEETMARIEKMMYEIVPTFRRALETPEEDQAVLAKREPAFIGR